MDSVVTCPCVKGCHAQFLHFRRTQVVQQVVNLTEAVADGRAGKEYCTTVTLVHLLQITYTVQQGNSTLTAFLVAKTCHAVVCADVWQALEVLTFIDKQIVNAQALKGKLAVYLPVKQAGELCFKVGLAFL